MIYCAALSHSIYTFQSWMFTGKLSSLICLFIYLTVWGSHRPVAPFMSEEYINSAEISKNRLGIQKWVEMATLSWGCHIWAFCYHLSQVVINWLRCGTTTPTWMLFDSILILLFSTAPALGFSIGGCKSASFQIQWVQSGLSQGLFQKSVGAIAPL